MSCEPLRPAVPERLTYHDWVVHDVDQLGHLNGSILGRDQSDCTR
jgi:hypothetical protein